MSGETERQPSGWTTDTVKVLEDEKIGALERLFTAEIRRLEAIIHAQSDAVKLLGDANRLAQEKFEASVANRFTSVNEFRNSLADLGAQMATRRELESTIAVTGARFEDHSKQLGDLRSRLDVGPAGLAALATTQATQTGRQQGVGLFSNAAYLMAVLLVAVISVVVIYATRTNSHPAAPTVDCTAAYHPAPCP